MYQLRDVSLPALEGSARHSANIEGELLIRHRDGPAGVHTTFVCVAGLSPTHVRCDGVSPDQQ